MTAAGAWLVAGLLLGALELVVPGVFLLWIGLAACGTGLLTQATNLGWHGQLACFVALAGALVALIALRRRPAPDPVNTPTAGLIGSICFAIDFQAGEGRVRFRDGTWQARTTDRDAPGVNDPLRVVGLDGTVLLVTRHGVIDG